MRRGVEGAGREDEDVVEPEIVPVDGAEGGDLRLHLDPQHIDRERVAEPQPERGRDLLLDADQRRAPVIGRPPCAANELAAVRQDRAIG